ncbi:hypothetical protein [Xanthomonas arboricola]|uniref:hypothetical protein n=1 Tax=Xanthomonas arboricola TaxID=56448 RepID=UPI00161A60C7|nr:hypothetical protein [Xanthomonas arboricola]MBB5860236.1 putative XRE-type DNA-binding protein [Xanthomonas arboricola]
MLNFFTAKSQHVIISGDRPSRADSVDIDLVFRIQANSSFATTSVASTKHFVGPFEKLYKDCAALARTVVSLRSTSDYHAEYINLLLTEAGDEEFSQLELSFARDQVEVSDDVIFHQVEAIQRWIPQWHVTADEVADILNVDADRVDEVVRSSPQSETTLKTGAIWRQMDLLGQR